MRDNQMNKVHLNKGLSGLRDNCTTQYWVRLGMHCKVKKMEVDPINISPNNLSSDYLCSVDIAQIYWLLIMLTCWTGSRRTDYPTLIQLKRTKVQIKYKMIELCIDVHCLYHVQCTYINAICNFKVAYYEGIYRRLCLTKTS